jgi:hypothetical protein
VMVMAIGDLRFVIDDDGTREPQGIGWSVEISSSRKVDKKAGEKEDDASVTDKGREARDVTAKFSWGDTEEANARARVIVEKLDPSNPKPGDPPAFAFERNGLDVAKLKNVRAIKWEKAKGPNFDEAGVVTYELTGASWTKPKPSAGAGTPGQAKKFVQPGAKVEGFGGIPGNVVTFPPVVPVAKPGAPKP